MSYQARSRSGHANQRGGHQGYGRDQRYNRQQEAQTQDRYAREYDDYYGDEEEEYIVLNEEQQRFIRQKQQVVKT